ncbi:hypothetical protein D6817_00595 [Candidatus Pacearchaeota archaeon]|nr:MAG: hypothetical protein D6817_00595 [Candidatus Pacearchaeota archaeon]
MARASRKSASAEQRLGKSLAEIFLWSFVASIAENLSKHPEILKGKEEKGKEQEGGKSSASASGSVKEVGEGEMVRSPFSLERGAGVLPAQSAPHAPARALPQPMRAAQQPQPRSVQARPGTQRPARPWQTRRRVMRLPASPFLYSLSRKPTPRFNVLPAPPRKMAPSGLPEAPPAQAKSPQQIEAEAQEFGRLKPLLLDPSVISVECPGAGKPIIVNRAGQLQTTQLTLTKEEINTILDNISKKTKIPIIPGLFKAAFGDYIVTAVISEVADTRFLVQKRYVR